MKVIAPGRLLAEAADVLAHVRDDVVVVGAAAIEVALADALDEPITPTRDIDVVVSTEGAALVVRELEAAGLNRSDLPHERAFTWVRDDLKVQLVRSFTRFRSHPRDRCRSTRCSAWPPTRRTRPMCRSPMRQRSCGCVAPTRPA